MGNKKGIRHRDRKWATPDELMSSWEDYKSYCNNRRVLKSQFNSREGVFVTDAIPSATSYDITGFCSWAGISSYGFYKIYANDDEFVDVINAIKTQCEADVREKLEQGVIPSGLAALWMARHGYTTKNEESIKVVSDDTTKALDAFFEAKKHQEDDLK